MKRFLVVLLFFVGAIEFVANAQHTRAELAKIRVSKEGNFKYWNEDSPALSQLKAFVANVTNPSSESFVPVKDRIATFDVDGTLLCETAPFYFNWIFAFHRYLHDDTFSPSEADKKMMQEMENYVYANHASKDEWGMKQQEMQAKSFHGMTFEEFSAYLQNYLETKPVDGFANLTWGCALYWPMIEAVSYLVANDFTVFLCSGDDRDICRVLAKDIYEIPSYQMLTSDVNHVSHSQAQSGEWTERVTTEGFNYIPGERIERGDFKQLCTALNKIVYLRRELGVKPILSWGNSSGDYPMFHYTNIDNPLPHISFCLLCDDTEREFGNIDKADKCRAACNENGWIPVSMRDEWRTIYGYDVKRNK